MLYSTTGGILTRVNKQGAPLMSKKTRLAIWSVRRVRDRGREG
jgi:hypothetical protein